MSKINEKLYKQWYDELIYLAHKLDPYYDIDKVKDWAVFVYDKDENKNSDIGLFDILDNKIIFYTDDHTIKPEARPMIKEIQKHFKNTYYRR